ncbi:MAG: AmmeMemoRadiSam system protein B [Phycisphaerae bacterium]|nr:AmmeMemoRadiSam system protein B [Phycisphaerae bacterium]
MMVRDPIVSGQFYPGRRDACLKQIEECMPGDLDAEALPKALFGGIVPHAGWTFSGPTAARVFASLAERRSPKVVVLFGADHARATRSGAVFGEGRWSSPLGDVDVDDRLAERITSMTQVVENDPHAHGREHSIEVQIPFVKHLWQEASILPIIVTSGPRAIEVGQAVARAIEAYKTDAVVIGSTDLTHYGANYGFTPRGIGPEALAWAKDVNDRRLIDRILDFDAQGVIEDAAANHSACGAGAIAATIAACRQLGATQAAVLEHTTSHEISRRMFDESATIAVGYAGIVFGQ